MNGVGTSIRLILVSGAGILARCAAKKGRYYNVMVKTGVILGESEFLFILALRRIEMKLIKTFLIASRNLVGLLW